MFKRLTLALFLGFSAVFSVLARPLGPETINYDVMFKWGLINKKAGVVSITLAEDGDKYSSRLTGTSASWADRFFKVRDTLSGRMTKKDMTPLFYEKIAHEGGKHKHDIVTYNYSTPGIVKADCIRRAFNKDGDMTVDERRQLEANGAAIDMLTLPVSETSGLIKTPISHTTLLSHSHPKAAKKRPTTWMRGFPPNPTAFR